MSEPIFDEDELSKTDLMTVGGNIASKINYKLSIFMFIIGMFIFSDLFVESFLHGIPDAVDGEYPTTKGTVVQLTVFCLVLLVLDLLIETDWV